MDIGNKKLVDVTVEEFVDFLYDAQLNKTHEIVSDANKHLQDMVSLLQLIANRLDR
jgi:hypothetical protein